MFTGSLVALITPFKNGSVDEKGFEKFVAWQIKEGTDGLVPCGTTGESPTLSMEEHKRGIEICIAAAKGTGVPVIAGTGSNSTEEAIDLTRHAKKAGADAVQSSPFSASSSRVPASSGAPGGRYGQCTSSLGAFGVPKNDGNQDATEGCHSVQSDRAAATDAIAKVRDAGLTSGASNGAAR